MRVQLTRCSAPNLPQTTPFSIRSPRPEADLPPQHSIGATMNPLPELSPYLKQLRLSGILDSLEARNRQAIESKLAYTEFLVLLMQDEIARRDQMKFTTRLR